MNRVAIQITFRPSVSASAPIRERIEHHGAKLDTMSNRIIRIHVTLDAPHRHQTHGRHYTVRIDIDVPSETLVVNRGVGERSHADLYAVIDDAFDGAARVVGRYMERHRFDANGSSP
jgi:ribosome-associated translation inhibitor RaiA